MKKKFTAGAAGVLALALSLLASSCYLSDPGGYPGPPPPPPPRPGPGPGPGHMPGMRGTDADFYGMRYGPAQGLARRRGLIPRLVQRDGVNLPVTRDYHPNRVNFSIDRGIVVRVSRG